MAQFRKKPVVVGAIRMPNKFVVNTLEGQMKGDRGDWLITGTSGEKYPCKHEIFIKIYEPVDEVGFEMMNDPRM